MEEKKPPSIAVAVSVKQTEDGHRHGDRLSMNSARALLPADDTPFLSAKNLVNSHKVQKLLDTTINENFCELVLYMKDAVPDFCGIFLPPAAEEPNLVEESLPTAEKQQRLVIAQRQSVSFSSATALRSALENRVVNIHTRFLQEWSTLTEVFEDVSDLVFKLQQESEALQTTLNKHVAVAEDFVNLMSTLRAELFLVRQQEKEMREFQETYKFSEEELKVLENGSVDAAYLEILQHAQMTYRKCRELLFSREHYQSAAALMDITYSAIIKGTERVARYLISTFATSSGVALLGGDSHDMPTFCLRCVEFLREENFSQWVVVVEDVARLRRAALLRHYFHLMTTGSSTTATGIYHAGVVENSDAKTNNSGIRPLEAEIENPVFFFGSLFAWLHQVIVEEDDFLSAFFSPLSLQEAAEATSITAPVFFDVADGCSRDSDNKDLVIAHTQGGNAVAAGGDVFDRSQNGAPLLNKATVLNSVFEVLCKHIQGVFDGVLERFLRGVSEHTSSDSGSVSVVSPHASGPIGLTGGIARLLSAAAGRTVPSVSDGTCGTKRYQHVRTRAQQEALVASALLGLTSALCTLHTLLQLFAYYSRSTFTALLGSGAALTRLVANDLRLQLLRAYNTIAKQLSERLLDSVAGVAGRCAVLRSFLASTEAAGSAEGIDEEKRETATNFVTEYLFKHTTEEEKFIDCAIFYEKKSLLLQQHDSQEQQLQSSLGGSSSGLLNCSGSTNPYNRTFRLKHHARLAELVRALHSMILPVPPEVQECLRVLKTAMEEAEKHAEIMQALQTVPPKNVAHRDFPAMNASDSYEPFFIVLVQHLLSFPLLLAQNSTISNALDEPCKLVLQLNTMSALQETLALHPSLLKSESDTAMQTRPLLDVVSERVHELSGALTTVLSACAVRHYFCCASNSNLMTTTVTTSDSRKHSTFDTIAIKEETETECGGLDAATIVAQLSNFYGFVASSGRVFVPLVEALQSVTIRDEVFQKVLQALCEVYKARYGQLLELQRQERQGSLHSDKVADAAFSSSAVDDLDPQKLRVLLDLSF